MSEEEKDIAWVKQALESGDRRLVYVITRAEWDLLLPKQGPIVGYAPWDVQVPTCSGDQVTSDDQDIDWVKDTLDNLDRDEELRSITKAITAAIHDRVIGLKAPLIDSVLELPGLGCAVVKGSRLVSGKVVLDVQVKLDPGVFAPASSYMLNMEIQ